MRVAQVYYESEKEEESPRSSRFNEDSHDGLWVNKISIAFTQPHRHIRGG